MEEGQNNKEEQPVNEATEPVSGEKKTKKVMKTIDLPVDCVVKGLNQTDLNRIIEQEAQMVSADKLENDRINAKNAVEEYVYDIRGRIYEDLESYISETDREKLSRFLEDTENWLYEDGEDCAKQIYVDKLSELKKLGEPVKERKLQREELPVVFELFLQSLQQARKVCEMYRDGNEKFNHLDSAEIEKVKKAINERQQYIDSNFGLVSNTPLHCDPPITSSQIKSEKGTFDALVNPIINKPKPKPKVEEPPPADKNSDTNNKAQQNSQETAKESEKKPTEPMDVD